MTVSIAITATVPAYPLGRPVDRLRYGMTPQQARLYRWLVANRPHGEAFRVEFREAGAALRMSPVTVHFCIMELIDRGWMRQLPSKSWCKYAFVAPVMRFREVCR